MGPEDAPRAAQDAPKTAQECQRTSPRCSETLQKRPKMPTRCPQPISKCPQMPPRPPLSHCFCFVLFRFLSFSLFSLSLCLSLALLPPFPLLSFLSYFSSLFFSSLHPLFYLAAGDSFTYWALLGRSWSDLRGSPISDRFFDRF